MHHHRNSRSAALVLATVLLFVAVTAIGGGALGPPSHATGSTSAGSVAGVVVLTSSPLSATLTVNPSQVQEGQQFNVQVTASGGAPPYSYSYTGLPSGCGGQSGASFSCNPSSTGTFSLDATVTDSGSNHTQTSSVSVTVTSSSNGNGNGNGNGGGNNSSGGLSSLFSGFSGILSLFLIFGIIGFATWVLLIIGVWIIAITLLRRLPKRGATDPAAVGGKCAACAAAIPAGARFCPACGAGTAPKAA